MSPKIVIRRIHPHEHTAATAVWQRSWESAAVGHPDDLKDAALPERFKRELTDTWDLFVADYRGEIVGLLALKPSENRLDQLFVAPEYQGRGVGKTLLNFAKKRLPKEVWLRTAEQNTHAIEFYKAAGFSTIRVEARPEWDRNDVLMIWRAS